MSHHQGQPLTVQTNSFVITRLPTKAYHQYTVEFDPPQKIRRRRQEIIHELQIQHPQFFNPRSAYDGTAILYASRILNFGGGSGATLPVTLGTGRPRQLQPGERPRGVVNVRLTRTQAEPVRPMHLNALIQQQGSHAMTETTTATNLLQLMVNQGQNWTKYPRNSRAYFTQVGSLKIDGGLELWRGYFQSVRPSVGKMLINVDISMAAMYQGGSVVEIAMEVVRQAKLAQQGGGKRHISNVRDDLALNANDPMFHRLERFFKKLLITVESPGMKGARKTIYGLEAKGGTFSFSDNGRETTVAEYFKHKYNIHIRHRDVFGCIISRKNDPNKIIVPAELCNVVPGQLYRGRIPEGVQSGAVQKFANMKPSDRLRAIQTGMVHNVQLESPTQQYKNNDIIADAGMEVSLQPLVVNGRILEVPRLLCSHNSQPIQPRNGSWNVVNKEFHSPEKMQVWAVVNFVPEIPVSVTRDFVDMLKTCCTRLGMKVRDCSCIINGSAHGPVKSMDEALQEMLAYMNKHKLKPQHILAIVILPQSADATRAAIKLWGDVQNGVITQCVREGKVYSNKRPVFNDQYCNNVALKLNARLGGINSIPSSSTINRLGSGVIIMGADVSHPGPGVQDKPSVASLVFSRNKDGLGIQYAAITKLQPPRQEIIVDLAEMVSRAVFAYGIKNRISPSAIIFYRDGVSEGEYEMVAEKEINAIRQGIDLAWAQVNVRDVKPKLTFIVVGKKHHVRFFPPKSHEDRSGNCPAGFVADVGLQSPFCPDFYLLSHGGLLGTSRPSHYIVLRDENFGSDINTLQSLSFTLCHAYCKATRSVSIPAPVYYADLVCSRAAFYFDSRLDYTGSNASTASGGGSTFNLDLWRMGYKHIHEKLFDSMYFL